MKKAVIYARYSCEKQTEQSIDGQLDVCNKYANENGFDVVGIYIDRATTATNDNRKEFQQMLADSALKKWEAVIVYKLDRFARNKYESALNRKKLRDNGVRLVSAMENIPDTAEGILLESVLEGLNEYFSIELGQKVKRGIRECMKNGKSTGGQRTFGYTIDANKNYVIDEENAEKVRIIFDMAVKGKNVGEIALVFPQFTTTQIHKLLKNKKYLGHLYYEDEIFENVIPRIIDDETFLVANKTIDAQMRNFAHKHQAKYELTGRVFCGECGHTLQGQSGYGTHRNGERGKSYYYYVCPTKCIQRIKKDTLEDIIADCLVKVLRERSKAIAKSTITILKDKAKNGALSALQKRKNAVERKISNVYSSLENIGYNETLKNRLTELQVELNQISEQLVKSMTLPTTQDEIEKYLLSMLDKKNKDLKHTILHDLVKRVYVFKDHIDIYCSNGTPPDKISQTENGGSPQLALCEINIFIYESFFVVECQIKKAP